MTKALSGLLNIAKPAGLTSRQVVDRVQRVVRPAKAGHAGTLDPLAVGVLIVCVGQATRLIEYVQRMPKTYVAEFLLGRTSDTEDIEGTVVELIDPPIPSLVAIEQAIPAFLGTIMQRPPAYSALKVQGRRAYDMARAGEQFELAARPIEIHAIDILGYEYPQLRLRIRCGSGTYIRSLGRDIALALDTGAVMSALERTAIGGFTSDAGIDAEFLTPANLGEHLRSPRHAVAELPSVVVTPDEQQLLTNGRAIVRTEFASAEAALPEELVALDEAGNLVGLLAPVTRELWKPARNFA
ncbi:MAG: tRNA pseudouridine(55) synthase TruB [Planctomycetia bacterium]|nr:tRNA pseudouridine(55) synthase TruB [Planctomycetia bacterium]